MADTQIIFDQRDLFAADVLDNQGRPVLPRQEPYEKLIQLRMTMAGQADEGGYVDVRLDPPDTLRLLPTHESCELLAGAFRCTADEDGFASFTVRSEADLSGPVVLQIVGGKGEYKTLQVNPAGLPIEAGDAVMVIGGVGEFDTNVIPATNVSLSCSIGPVPSIKFDKWPPGKVRVREAVVRAAPPAALPGVITNAPVIVQTLHPEVELSLSPQCRMEDRRATVRVLLDHLGESQPFFICFSDIGGENVRISLTSGEKISAANPDTRILQVDAEPRLIRLLSTNTHFEYSGQTKKVLEISAIDAELNRVRMNVDVESSNPSIIQLDEATIELSELGEVGAILNGTSGDPGMAVINVRPEFFSEPECKSEIYTVEAP